MALTAFQRRICRILAANRRDAGDSYVAGGTALNEILASPRVSRDIDLFHDAEDAVMANWDRDRETLRRHGLGVRVVRERPAYVEAAISAGSDVVVVEWTRDSAFRFFPLMQHDELGLVLHPFDLATNKVLALVGRLEVRDWVDVIHCAQRLQPLGCLAWAASGKDPGFGPSAILEQAARSSHYSNDEISALAFTGPPPDAAALSRTWRALLDDAHRMIDALPANEVGTCVLWKRGELFVGSVSHAREALARGELVFHRGRLRGALPQIVE
ncbi:MAG TPA: hypothetical protein VIC33_11600 [Vicinamibacterales bacterium]|jgi:hypothetical protein